MRRYNGPGYDDDGANDIAVDGSSNVYVTGYSVGNGTSSDYATIKYYTNGDTAWVRRYNGPANSSDGANSLAIDGSGDVYVTGYSLGNDTSLNYVTIKYYPNGDTAWVRIYNGPANGDDYAKAIALDGSGNVYVTGYSTGSGTDLDYATIKYDSQGNELWVKRYNGPANGDDYAKAIASDGSGNVYVTGHSNGGGFYNDYATIKYYSNGDTSWVRRYDRSSEEDAANALAVDGSGNVYVTGYSGPGVGKDYTTIKYYPNGDTAWVRRYNGPAQDQDYATAIAVDGSSNIYVTGQVRASGPPASQYDYATVKYDSSGNRIWDRIYWDTVWYANDVPNDIVVDSFGNSYVTGSYSSRAAGTRPHYATIKYYPNGEIAWLMTFNSGLRNDYAYAIAIDGSGNVYITGEGDGNYDYNLPYDYITIKYWQNYPPNSFSLLSPSNSFMIPYVVIFYWEIAIDPDPWDTAKYDLYISTSSMFHPDSTVIYDSLTTNQYNDTLGIGRYYWKVRAYDKHSEVWSNQTWTFLSALYGDANGDKQVSIADVIYLINFLFRSGSAPIPFESGDTNCDSFVTVSDVVYLINYLFKGGPQPGC